MTTTPKPRMTSMHREGHTQHYTFSDGTTADARIDWTIDDARDGLVEQWLETRDVGGARVIRDDDGKALGMLVSADEYEEGRNAVHRINEDSYGQKDEGYNPFRHHPAATPDRIINTDSLETIIRNLVHGKGSSPEDLTRDERDSIRYASLVAALEFQFDPDSRGMVPVMTPGRASDSPTATEYYWSFLYPTPVAGLFLRPDDHFVGIEYTLTTGSGYTVVRGFWDRDYANELAVKLGEALPGINWFTARNGDDLTKDIKATMLGIIREHGLWRKDEQGSSDAAD